jgi:hypothetical protein
MQPRTTVEALIQHDDNANESSIWIVFRKMLFFTLLMTIAPLGSFFIAKDYVFEGLFHVSSRSSYTYSAVVAVIVAFREDIPGKKKKPADVAKVSTSKAD